MNITLKIFLIALLVVQILLIVQTVKRKKMTIRYASFWLVAIALMCMVVVFPNFLFKLTELVGFEKTSNMVFLLGFFFLFYVSFIITTTVSVQNKKIKNLIQELSLLKESALKDDKKE